MSADDVVDAIGALEGADVVVWVDGGWGVDALLAEQTRKHDDLNVVVDADHVPRLVVVLGGLGYVEIRIWSAAPEGFVLRAPGDRRIDIHPVRFDEEGNGLQRLAGGVEWPYPAHGFAGTGTIGGSTVRCLTPEVQVACHAGYELKPTDIHDMRALHERFGVELLPEQRAAISAGDLGP